MAHITDPPPTDAGDFGHEFNYSVWTPGTRVTLCNVPWNSDYRDIVRFTSQNDIDQYLNSNAGPSVTFDNLTYARVGHPVRIPLPFNDAYKYNYLRVRNSAQPVGESGPRTFYYFIRDVRYIAPNTTELDIQLDVWQTFGREVEFGNCYVERGHLGVANENQFSDYGREYLTIPEGFDLGNEYMIRGDYTHEIARGGESTTQTDRIAVLVVTTVAFGGSGGNVESPILETAGGSMFEGLPNGAEIYYFDRLSQFRQLMRDVRDMPWISQGIIGVYAIPRIPADQLDADDVTWEQAGGMVMKRLNNFKVKPERINLRTDWREHQRGLLPERYRHLRKFLTYPYMLVELTTYSGNPLVLKPESMDGSNLEAVVLQHLAPPAPRVVVYPFRYNTGGLPTEYEGGDIFNDRSEFLDMVTGIFNLPTFSLVNNGYLSFMASNAHTIPYQHAAADWSQQRALAGNQLGYDQASQSMALERDLMRQGIGAATAQTELANTTGGLRALQSGVGGVVGGLGAGGVGVAAGALGAVNAGVSHAIDVNQRNQSLAIQTGLTRGTTQSRQGTSAFMRDTNKDFADFAARGDYEMAISGINAKVQDAKMIQPTTSGQMGGDAFNLVHYRWAVHAKVKVLQRAAMHAIGEFWLRYGYRVNRFAHLARLNVMTRFTYWKLTETYITSSTCPEMFRQTIRGIFEKGVTVWENPADIGNIDIADNEPLSGVTL